MIWWSDLAWKNYNRYHHRSCYCHHQHYNRNPMFVTCTSSNNLLMLTVNLWGSSELLVVILQVQWLLCTEWSSPLSVSQSTLCLHLCFTVHTHVHTLFHRNCIKELGAQLFQLQRQPKSNILETDSFSYYVSLICTLPFICLCLSSCSQVSETYKCHDKKALPPHIFAVADRAYQSMLGRLGTGPENQCIVIR